LPSHGKDRGFDPRWGWICLSLYLYSFVWLNHNHAHDDNDDSFVRNPVKLVRSDLDDDLDRKDNDDPCKGHKDNRLSDEINRDDL
jgi:hypothetical protein